MSTTSNITVYTIQVNANSGDGGQLIFTSSGGATDQFVLNLMQAMVGVTWPGNEAPPQIESSKSVQSDTVYQASTATTPLAWS